VSLTRDIKERPIRVDFDPSGSDDSSAKPARVYGCWFFTTNRSARGSRRRA